MSLKKVRHTILFLRKKNGLTQLQLAKKSKVSETTICDIEKGNVTPSPESLDKIAGVFGMNMIQLLSYTNEELEGSEAKEEIEIDERTTIIKWALSPENFEYLKFIYDIAVGMGLPKSMLSNVKIEIKNPNK